MASQALLKAVTSARFTQTRLMLRMGADVNARDVEGQTPLIRALCLASPKVRTPFLRLLLKAGALVSVSDKKHRNALMWACSVGSVDDVSLLLRHADVDLNINAQNSAGQTALWTAVDGDRVDIVEKLLGVFTQHELNFEVTDHAGVTPAQLAAKLGHFKCLQAMIKHLDTTDRSVNALTNMAKLSKILNSFKSDPEGVTERTQPQGSLQSMQNLPTIRIISSEGHSLLSLNPRPNPQRERTSFMSVGFLENPSRSSTPASCGHYTLSRSPSPAFARELTRVENARDERLSTRLPRVGGTSLVEHGGSHSQTSLISSEWKRSRSSADVSDQLARHPEVVLLSPVTAVALGTESVRHSLPVLFEVRAQQMSDSFRKAARKPPLPKPKPQPGTNWSKLKGLALIAGLGRSGNFVDKAAGTTSVSGHSSAPDNHPQAGMTKLFLPKQRIVGSIKQHTG